MRYYSVPRYFIVGLLFKIRAFFQPKRKYEVRGIRFKMADFWVRPGIVTMGGSNRSVTVEIEYAPSVSCFILEW